MATREQIIKRCQKRVDEFNLKMAELKAKCGFGDEVLVDEDGLYYTLNDLKLKVFKRKAYLSFYTNRGDFYGKMYHETSEPVFYEYGGQVDSTTNVFGGFNEFMRMFNSDLKRAYKFMNMTTEEIDRYCGY